MKAILLLITVALFHLHSGAQDLTKAQYRADFILKITVKLTADSTNGDVILNNALQQLKKR